jgi:hypothetical protein
MRRPQSSSTRPGLARVAVGLSGVLKVVGLQN